MYSIYFLLFLSNSFNSHSDHCQKRAYFIDHRKNWESISDDLQKIKTDRDKSRECLRVMVDAKKEEIMNFFGEKQKNSDQPPIGSYRYNKQLLAQHRSIPGSVLVK